MRCMHPVLVRSSRFSDGQIHYIAVPCGKCIACRVNRSEQLAGEIQLEHESALRRGLFSYFCTLTYNDENLPAGNNLCKKHVQDFNKRMRHYCSEYRFFACGEYGSKSDRCHYHLCVFTDLSESRFRESLQRCWTFGFSSYKLMHKNSPRYISKYVVKFDSRDHPDQVKPFILRSQNFGKPLDPKDRQNYLDNCTDEIRSLAKIDRPAIYRDILGKKHPYPRKIISRSFTYKEKEENSFKGYFDDFIHNLYVSSGSKLPFEDFRISYIRDMEVNQELYYYQHNFRKKFKK